MVHHSGPEEREDLFSEWRKC